MNDDGIPKKNVSHTCVAKKSAYSSYLDRVIVNFRSPLSQSVTGNFFVWQAVVPCFKFQTFEFPLNNGGFCVS